MKEINQCTCLSAKKTNWFHISMWICYCIIVALSIGIAVTHDYYVHREDYVNN